MVHSQSSDPVVRDPARAPRRSNLARSAYHALNAVVVVALADLLLPDARWRVAISGVGLAAAWSMEVARRLDPRVNARLMTLFRQVAHPHEVDHVNSATWYTTAIFLLSVVPPLWAGVAGLLVLGFGDPLAGIVGRAWGRHRFADGRSVEGSTAFVAGGFAVAWGWLTFAHPEVAHPGWAALAAAVGGAAGELFSRRVDDNLLIPLAASASAWLVSGW
ncbi:MAG: diacylglycerol/polyprenol kinase family protein [Myxococcota bacterium]